MGSFFEAARSRRIVLFGILLGSLYTLRPTFIVCFVLFFVMATISRFRSGWFRFSFIANAFALIFILPLVLMLWKTFHTPLFPLISGTFNTQYGTFSSDHLRVTPWGMVWKGFGETEIALGLASLVASLLIWRRWSLNELLLLSGIIGTSICNYKLPASEKAIHGLRYCFPFLIAPFAISVPRYLKVVVPYMNSRLSLTRSRFLVRATVVVLLISCTFSITAKVLELEGIARARHDPDEDARVQLKIIQDQTDAGSVILVAIDQPYLLNFKRNEVLSLDVPGQVNPNGVYPFDWSREKIESHFRSLGVKYLILMDPKASVFQFSRVIWTRLFEQKEEHANYLYNWSVWNLKFIDFVDAEIARTSSRERSGPFVLIKL